MQDVASQIGSKVLTEGWDLVQGRNLDLVRLLSAVERSHRLWNYSIKHNNHLVHMSADYKPDKEKEQDSFNM